MTIYLMLDGLLALVQQPEGDVCRKLLKDHVALFERVPGSSHNHQAWPGGYLDHVAESMNIARVLYPALAKLRPLPFSLSDALLVLFLHDLEKPWKYQLDPQGELEFVPELRSKEAQHAFRKNKLREYGLVLTAEQANALDFAEGEIHDYSPRERKMHELATFVHLCDVTSARLWYAHPLSTHDSWPGARRHASQP